MENYSDRISIHLPIKASSKNGQLRISNELVLTLKVNKNSLNYEAEELMFRSECIDKDP